MRIAIITLPLHGNYGGILQNRHPAASLFAGGHHVDVFAESTNHPFFGQLAVQGFFLSRTYIIVRGVSERLFLHNVHSSFRSFELGIIDSGDITINSRFYLCHAASDTYNTQKVVSY